MSDQEKKLDLANMSDEEIMNLDPATLGESESELPVIGEPEQEQDPSTSAADETGETTDTEETDGAVSEDQLEPEVDGGADSTSADPFDGSSADELTGEEAVSTPEDDQTTGSETDDTPEPDSSSGDVDYKAEYERLMAPFKAYKRQITPESVEEVRQLMSKGADYARKMQDMKPYLRVFKTLERNDLIDPEKINFLIELDKGNPEAIKRFLRDKSVDPMEVDLEDKTDWRPNDHMVGDAELALNDVLDNIRPTNSFDRTVNVITKEWDKASQDVLLDNPKVIQDINDHMEAGIFDMVVDRIARERIFGRLDGLSDLQAYKTVGDAMFEEGAFNAPAPDTPPATGKTEQGPSQDGSKPAPKKADLENRKRAASPTKGNASPGKEKIDLSKLSDEEIMKLDPRSL